MLHFTMIFDPYASVILRNKKKNEQSKIRERWSLLNKKQNVQPETIMFAEGLHFLFKNEVDLPGNR